MNAPTVRVVHLADSQEGRGAAAGPAAGADIRTLPVQTHVPLSLLAAVGERVAESATRMQAAAPGDCAGAALAEAERLERFGLQLQELAQVAARAQQLRRESVDLGLALVQTVAEWSAEADRLGVELHGPACSEPVHANPAALKHLLDLMVEHALQQGRAVRLEVEVPATGSGVAVVATVSSEPASQSPERDTLAWMALQWFARALGLTPARQVVARGERLSLLLPRG
jgi:hypothetical protein